MSRWLPGIALIAACGGGGHGAGGTGTGPNEGGCEPGRCLGDISRTIGEHKAEARACFEAGRKKQPKLAGQLVINFEIDAAGSVVDTSQGMQDGQLDDAEVVACVSAVVKKIKFPKSAAGKSTRGYHRFEFASR
jgi:hypothetical protein